MGTSSITNILTIFLIVSVIILFVLVIAFVILMIKRRTEDQKGEEPLTTAPCFSAHSTACK